MPSSEPFRFDHPDFFVAGAIGEPGNRVFYLQSGQDGEVVSLRCEKQHVAVLAQHLDELLSDLPPSVPDPFSRSLREPVETTWLLGSLAFGFDESSDRVVIIASELVVVDEGEEPREPAEGRLAITRGQAASLIATTEELLAGGRPLCRICGLPMDVDGHICPRSNGHHKG